jgi:hypothetical protein
MKRSFILAHSTARRNALACVADAPDGFCVIVQPKTRSMEQNAKFHALCEDAARAGMTWAGKARNAAEWKVLFVSGHAVATKEGSEIIPGLESEFVNIRESTALMGVKRGSSLIEYTQAFVATRQAEHA